MAEPAGRWRRGVICPICPRSVRDSDGDGAGDLRETVEKFRHLRALSVDALRFSPLRPPPLTAFGTGFSACRVSEPPFGTPEAFERLLAMAPSAGRRSDLRRRLKQTADRMPLDTPPGQGGGDRVQRPARNAGAAGAP